MTHTDKFLAMIKTLAGSLLAFVLIIFVGIFCVKKIGDLTFFECSAHVSEIYKQVTKSFVSVLLQNWLALVDWNNHITPLDDNSTQDYLLDRQKTWLFSDFFFIARDGHYINIKGERGKFSGGFYNTGGVEGDFTPSAPSNKSEPPNIEASFLNNISRNIFFVESIDEDKKKSSLAIATIAVKHNIYKGFEYDSVGVGYSNKDLEKVLSIDSFAGLAECLVVSSDGIVVFSNSQKKIFGNYLTYLKNESNIGSDNLTTIKREWQPFKGDIGDKVDSSGVDKSISRISWRGNTRFVGGLGMTHIKGSDGITRYRWGVIKARLGGLDQYLTYNNMNYGGLIVVGIVSDKAVHSSTRKIQILISLAIFSVFLILSLFLLFEIHKVYKRQRLRTLTELKYKELLFDILSTNVDDIFILVNGLTGEGEYVSPNIERLLGLKVESSEDYDLIVKKVMSGATKNLLPVGDKFMAVESIRDTPIDDNYQWNCEHINKATGEKRFYQESVYHIKIQDSDKYVFVLSDRTKERAILNKMEAALEIAKNANNAKSNFLSSMSHDIRTPMNAITGFLTLLTKDAGDKEKVLLWAKKIEKAADLLLELINNVLDMSKIESGKTQLMVEPFELGKVLDDTYDMNVEQAKAKAQFFTLHKPKGLPVTLLGDKLKITQILTNLISNSIKYTPTGGVINFSALVLKVNLNSFLKVRFVVEDNGIGMSQDFLKTLYEPFKRERKAEGVEGTGLGMAITKSFVDLMGGSIEVLSREGEGTKFTVDLIFPSQDHSEEGTTKAAIDNNNENIGHKDPASTDISGLKLLIAEDNELNSEILAEILKRKKARFVLCKDGVEVLDRYIESKENEFDAILLDVEMPRMNGLDACRKIRSLGRPDAKTIPIIAMTANAFEEDVRRALDAGMNAHLSKPLDMNLLCFLLCDLYNKSRHTRKNEHR